MQEIIKEVPKTPVEEEFKDTDEASETVEEETSA